MKKEELRNFGFIWSGIFLVVGIIPTFRGEGIKIWSIMIGAIFTVIVLVNPFVLSGFYKLWIKIGDFIGGIVSKIVLFILFFCIFTPISFVLRFAGKDLLNKKLDKNVNSYWIDRVNQPESMKNQF